MRLAKEFIDLAPSSAARKLSAGEVHWAPLLFEQINRLARARVSDSARWAAIELLPYLWDPARNILGTLTDESGQSIPVASLARRMGKTEQRLASQLDALLDIGVLKRDDAGILFNPWLVTATIARKYRTETSSNHDVSRSRGSGRNTEKSGTSSESKYNVEKQCSSNDDVSKLVVNRDLSRETDEKSLTVSACSKSDRVEENPLLQ